MNWLPDLRARREAHPLLVVSRYVHWRWTPLLERVCQVLAAEGVPVLQIGECPPQAEGAGAITERGPGVARLNVPTQASWRRHPVAYVGSHLHFRNHLIDIIAAVEPRALIFENVDLCPTILSVSRVYPQLRLIYWGTELSCQPRQVIFRHYERKLAPRLTGLVMNNPMRVRILKARVGCDVPSFVLPNTETRPANGRVYARQPLREMFARHNPAVKVIVVYTGNVSQQQAVRETVEALALVPPYIGFAFPRDVSNPKYVAEVEATVARLGLQDRVLRLEWVPFDQVTELNASADIGMVLLRPSDDNTRYCASSKLYRYMCAGLPMIGATVPGIAGIIETERIGLTCNPDAPGDIAAAIRKLDDPAMRAEMHRNAIEAFDQRHCLEVQWQEHGATLRQWIDGG